MESIVRILGKRGRITIPYKMRMVACFKPNDILKFEMVDCDTIIIKREYICDGCVNEKIYNNDIDDIEDIFDELTIKEKHDLLITLTEKWAKIIGGDNDERHSCIPLQH